MLTETRKVDGFRNLYWVARSLQPGESVAVQQALVLIEERLAPMSNKRLSEQLGRLAIHFQSKRSDLEMESLFYDFGEDLAEYSESHIMEAFRDWRRTEKFFPKLAEIIEILDAKRHTEKTLRHRARVLLGLEEPFGWERPSELVLPPPVSREKKESLMQQLERMTGPLARQLRSYLEKASEPEQQRRRA